jgi:Leucine-rich repeat (LRR) protein
MDPTLAKLLLLLITAATSTSSAAGCIAHERDALLDFKRGFTSDPSGRLDSWRQGNQDCCQWRGVVCSNLTGHVHELRLRNTDMVDVDDVWLPSYSNALSGKISPSLLALQHLEHLDLSSNYLCDDEVSADGYCCIPEFLGSLKNLKYLNLAGVQFSGTIPPQLGNLSNLQFLDLSNTGINSTDVSWLTRLTSLRHLNLQGADLSTVADWPHVVNMITSLRVLNFSSCLLTSANQSLPHLNLTSLEELDLSGNSFNHHAASCWFWNITSLVYLNLAYTDLYGQLPKALGDMTSLRYLSFRRTNIDLMMTDLKRLCSLRILDLQEYSSDENDVAELIDKLPQCFPNKLQELYLSNNQLRGVLPNSMQHLTSLVFLDLSINNIVGPLPTSIGQYLTSLVELYLQRNKLTGPIPKSVGNFTSLRTLDLSVNDLTGHVPYEIGMLTNLTELYLDDNYFDGVIKEDHFARIRSLEDISLSDNSLKIELSSEWQPPFRLQTADFATCQMGPLFPAWLRWQVDIKYLGISSTGLIGRLPHWFANAFSNTTTIDISDNQLNGGLPTNMEIMSVKELLLRSNRLTGEIPHFPRNLTVLDISNNSLSGPLPADLPNLEMLSLFSNRISGHIPKSICKSWSLMVLDLANNLLEGQLPKCFGNEQILTLKLSNNRLSGTLPPSIQNCTILRSLDLAENMFFGELPTWIADLVNLQFIGLSHNMFSGVIPINITSLKYLQYLDISNNELSGTLPSYLSNLKSFTKSPASGRDGGFYGGYNPGSLSAVTKGQILTYASIDRILDMHMVSIDLSSNNLTGSIPEEIVTLDALVNLDLSRNHFSGSVPYKIGDMQTLESIDFSRNNLFGDIPAGLSNLTFLSYLDLSYNNFTGRIPSGSQLDTLYAENPLMYTGNIGLCGPPIHKNCSSTNTSEQAHMKITEAAHEPEFFLPWTWMWLHSRYLGGFLFSAV